MIAHMHYIHYWKLICIHNVFHVIWTEIIFGHTVVDLVRFSRNLHYMYVFRAMETKVGVYQVVISKSIHYACKYMILVDVLRFFLHVCGPFY